jgi:integrase
MFFTSPPNNELSIMIKHSVKFDLVPGKSALLPVRVRVTYESKRVDFRLGYSVDPGKWDAAAGRVISGKNRYGQTASEINRAALDFVDAVEGVFVTFEHVERRAPSIDELRDAVNVATGKVKPHVEGKKKTFFEVFDEFTRVTGEHNEWQRCIYMRFNSIKNHLKAFDPTLSLDTLTLEKLQDYKSYLQYRANLRNTTIQKNLSFFRWFLRWAHANGYYAGKLHETFRPRMKGTDGKNKEVIHLTWDELMHLMNFKFPANELSLSPARDVFCFCCFTGLRYSDVKKLRRSDVKGDHILVVTKKTDESLKIELNKYSKAILDKYAGVDYPDDKALPAISIQRANDYLKLMGKMAGINDPQRVVYFKRNERIEEVYPKYALLSSHCGRRTFIVNALRIGVPAEVIMKWTGHSDYKAMKPYVKIVDELKVAEMGKFDNFMPAPKAVPKEMSINE